MPPTICFGHVGREPARREIVEEEERLGALHEDVVDAVVDEVLPDGVVAIGEERDLQLRADAVGARDEDRIAKPARLKSEQARRTSRCRTGRRA